jgi:hypothetical protein
MPATLLYDKTLPAVVRDTWARLRGLAWGKEETPPLSLDQICELLDVSHSTLYGHMLILRKRAALQWRAAGSKTLIVSFAECPPDLSRNLEKPSPSIPLNPGAKKESKKLEGEAIQKPGQSKKVESTPAAVVVYKDKTRLYPEKSLYDMVAQAVGDHSENLERWGAAITGWLAAGYSKKNIAGMLDWYRQGKTSKEAPHQEKPNGPKRNDAPGRGQAEPLSEAQRIARRLSGGGAVGGDHEGQGPRG